MKSFTMDPVDDFLKSKLNQPDFKPLTPYEAKIAQKHLEPIVAILLKGCGWEDDFCVLFGTNGKITLYLRIAYVAAYSIEGNWEHIKQKIPEIVQYATVAKELRSHRDISLFWIDKRIKDLDWKKFELVLSNATSED